jgi:hypothetical protein
MALIERSTYEDVERLAEELSPGLRSARSFESAAQGFAEQLIARFPSLVLARVFATVPHARLPGPERAVATSLAGEISLFPTSDVLTLFGTSGTRPAWNDRRRSRDHLAIPLLNRGQIDQAPMISRLLADLRFRLEEPPASESAPFVTRAFANANGLFYVADAGTTLDEKGRLVIPATEFVRDHDIGTVFGFGGSYVVQPMFVSTILFTKERVSKQSAMHFLQLSSAFKGATSRFVTRGLLFEHERVACQKG